MTCSKNRVPAAVATAEPSSWDDVEIIAATHRADEEKLATPRSVARPTEFRIMAALPLPLPTERCRLRHYRFALAYPSARDRSSSSLTLADDDAARRPPVSVQKSVDRRTTRAHGKQQPRLATRGGDDGHTVTMCQTEIARRRKQTPPRAIPLHRTYVRRPSRPPPPPRMLLLLATKIVRTNTVNIRGSHFS